MNQPWLSRLHVYSYSHRLPTSEPVAMNVHDGCTCEFETRALTVLITSMEMPEGCYLRMPRDPREWRES